MSKEFRRELELHVYKYQQSCRDRKKAVYRFGFPLPPLQTTLILEPFDSDI